MGTKEVNGWVYARRAARVRVHLGSLGSAPAAEWTNELTLGDSAGRRVMRWGTWGTRSGPAAASDLVPTPVGLKEGSVITAPFWSPAMTKAELRIFSVLGQATVDVEGSNVRAWKVEERRYSDRQLLATWYLVDTSPYMVYSEVPLPNGQTQRVTEAAIPMSEAR